MEVGHLSFAPYDFAALLDHHVAGERDDPGAHFINPAVRGSGLILLYDDDASQGLELTIGDLSLCPGCAVPAAMKSDR